jgi:hypothetical protein
MVWTGTKSTITEVIYLPIYQPWMMMMMMMMITVEKLVE